MLINLSTFASILNLHEFLSNNYEFVAILNWHEISLITSTCQNSPSRSFCKKIILSCAIRSIYENMINIEFSILMHHFGSTMIQYGSSMIQQQNRFNRLRQWFNNETNNEIIDQQRWINKQPNKQQCNSDSIGIWSYFKVGKCNQFAITSVA